jgi:hypothetical protein
MKIKQKIKILLTKKIFHLPLTFYLCFLFLEVISFVVFNQTEVNVFPVSKKLITIGSLTIVFPLSILIGVLGNNLVF